MKTNRNIKEELYTFLNEIPKETLEFLNIIVHIHSMLNDQREKNFSKIEKKMISFSIARQIMQADFLISRYFPEYISNKKEKNYKINLLQEEITNLENEGTKIIDLIDLSDKKWGILEQEYISYLFEGECRFHQKLTVVSLYMNFWNIEFPEDIIFEEKWLLDVKVLNELEKETKYYLFCIENIYTNLYPYYENLTEEETFFIALYEIPYKLQSPKLEELIKKLPQDLKKISDYLNPQTKMISWRKKEEEIVREKIEKFFINILRQLQKNDQKIDIFEIFCYIIKSEHYSFFLKKFLKHLTEKEKRYYLELLENIKIINEDESLLDTISLLKMDFDDNRGIEEQIKEQIMKLQNLIIPKNPNNHQELLFITSFFYHHVKIVQEIILTREEKNLIEEINSLIESCFLPETEGEILTNLKRKVLRKPPLPRRYDMEKLKIALPKLDSLFPTIKNEISILEKMETFIKILISKLTELLPLLKEDTMESSFAKQSFQVNKSFLEMELDLLENKKNAFFNNMLAIHTLRNYFYPFIISKEQGETLDLWTVEKMKEIYRSIEQDKLIRQKK